MNETRALQQRTEQTLDEHRQIYFYLDQLQLTLDELAKPTVEVEAMRRLAAQIEGLKERLVSHHRSEENDGLFQAILEVLPQRRVEISRLVREHARMIEILEMARIHAQNGSPDEVGNLCTDLRNFLDEFRDHERREDALLEEAMRRESETLT